MDPGQRLVYLLDATYATQEREDGFRSHLGASVLGDDCMRQVWFGWRWADTSEDQLEGRVLRLFARGHREEPVFVDLLRRLGAEVWTHDKQGQQFRIKAYGGHMGGSVDAVARGLPILPPYISKDDPVLLELKTHNDKQFKQLLSKGLKEGHPKHYKQANIYAHHLGIKYVLYCAVNKNDDSLWFYFFEADPQVGQMLTLRAETIIFGSGTPPRISESPAWFECRFCDMQQVCFGRKMPKVNCRTCAHSKAERDGTWSCAMARSEIQTKPKEGCEEHMFLPALMPWAQVVEFGQVHVAYSHRGEVKINGPGHIPSACLDLT